MATRAVTLSLPEALANELSALDEEVLNVLLARGLRQWRIEQALRRYTERELTFAAAAEYAGVSPE